MISFLKGIAKVTLYQPLYNALIFFVWLVPDHNVGWAIIIITLIVRVLLAPLNAGMIKSQKALQALQPEIERIKTDFKDDQQAQSKAMMELYQARKINPFGSCILLLVQLPVLWILYQVFTVGLDTSHFALLYSFVPRPDYMATAWLGIELTKPSLILGVLAGVAQFIQSRQLLGSQPKSTKKKGEDRTADATAMISQQSMYLFPVLTIFLSLTFPAALTLYWFVTTVAMAAQQWWMTRQPAADGSSAISITVRRPKA